METIKNTIMQFMQELECKKTGAAKDNPEVLLKKFLSTKELKHIKIKYFRKGTLGITVDSSTWLYYLNLQKERLLADLRNESTAIKEIRFRIGELSGKA
jgi:hypothetical protein